ncbi:hypothetical protein CCP3SC5AM1_1260004 [Gammaproteobacteria bacterium]
MAKLRTYQTMENTDYVFTFASEPQDVSSNDKALMTKYGEPEINLGGTFTLAQLTYTLPDQFVKILSGFPVKVKFSPDAAPWSDTNLDNKFDLYRTTIETRFSAAYTALRANDDTFTGEYVTNI